MQHVPVIQRKGENTMEEKNQPRRPRRSPEENTQKNESLVYGKNPVTELLKSGSGVESGSVVFCSCRFRIAPTS